MEKQTENGEIWELRKRTWEDMPCHVLSHIFSFLCMLDVVMNMSGVCKSWREAASDPVSWKTLDLTLFTTKFRCHPRYFYWMKENQLSCRFMILFKNVVNGSCGNLTKVIFDSSTFFMDEHLIHTAERSPNLKDLVLPSCPLVTEQGLKSALRLWRKLESLSISFCNCPPQVFQYIGENCKNFSAVKFHADLFDKNIALAMINFLPGLKIVTLRCGYIEKDAVEVLLDKLKNLEQLYISDRVDSFINGFPRFHLPIEDEDIIQKAARLQNFHICQDGYCTSCPTAPDNFSVIKES